MQDAADVRVPAHAFRPPSSAAGPEVEIENCEVKNAM